MRVGYLVLTVLFVQYYVTDASPVFWGRSTLSWLQTMLSEASGVTSFLPPLFALSKQQRLGVGDESASDRQARSLAYGLYRAFNEPGTLWRIIKHDWQSLWNNQTSNLVTREDAVQMKCFDQLGCIEYTPEWYNTPYRPLNHFPLDRSTINVTFWVQTRRHHGTIVADSNRSLIESDFSSTRPTKMIIHGFLDTGQDSWVKEMTSKLLDVGDFNVISVDWRIGALPLYQQAVANTRLVALEIAHLLNWLQRRHGLSLHKVHLIGHSLGAHTAGYVGAKVLGRLGRITGLDPAQPGFDHMSSAVRLDSRDAEFVDIIHTDGRNFLSGGFGLMQPCGHVDFYPNGGREQPGCGTYSEAVSNVAGDTVDDLEADLFACRHVRAIRFFSGSITNRPDCTFMAYMCPSYEDFLKGKCRTCGTDGSLCAPMGYYADQAQVTISRNGKFFTSTAASRPFCLYHYALTIEAEGVTGGDDQMLGHLDARFYSSVDNIYQHRMPDQGSMNLQFGLIRTFLIRTHLVIGEFMRLDLSWSSDRLLPCLLWCPPLKIRVLSLRISDMNHPQSDDIEFRPCPGSKSVILDSDVSSLQMFRHGICKHPTDQ